MVNKVTQGLKDYFSLEAQKKDEAKFDKQVDEVKEKVDTLGKRVVNFLETTAVDVLKSPSKVFAALQLVEAQKDEDGEEIPLSLKDKLGNFHKNVLIKGDEAARNAGEAAHLATRKSLQFVRKGAKCINRENMGATVQNSIALVIGAIVRGIFFIVSQLGHLRTPAAAVGIAAAVAVTAVVPQVACGILAVKTNNLTNEVKGLKAELKAKNRAEAAQAQQAATTKKRAAIALVATLVAGAAVAAYLNPAVVTSAASTVASGAKAIFSKVSSLFASRAAQLPMCGLNEGNATCSANTTLYTLAS